MARALGPGEDTEAHPELPEETPHFRSEDSPSSGPGLAGVEEVQGQADPAAVYPSGLLPKANKPGWENEGDLKEREMPGQVAGPWESPGSLERTPAGDPFPAGDPR